MTSLTSIDTVRATSATLGDLGARYMLHPDTSAAGTAAGYANGMAWYVAGRGGVLGDVHADVVVAAFGFFNPDLIRTMWAKGLETEGARAAATRYGQVCAEFGRARLQGVDGLDRFCELAERVVNAVHPSGVSLFAAWRGEPMPTDAPARAYWLIALLREWRGSEHIVAVRASGLTPLQSVLTGYDNEERIALAVRMMGYRDVTEDASALKQKRRDAEALTDALLVPGFDALTAEERGEFAALVDTIKDALDANK